MTDAPKRITARNGNVIYADFTPKPLRKTTKRLPPTGVFIKPMQSDTTMYAIKGNVAGFIASYIAFHPEFSPAIFGQQVRDEFGIITANDFDPEPPRAA